MKPKLSDLSIRQINHLKKQLEAIETLYRHNLHKTKYLELQKQKDYKYEYDRILGELSKTNLPGTTKTII